MRPAKVSRDKWGNWDSIRLSNSILHDPLTTPGFPSTTFGRAQAGEAQKSALKVGFGYFSSEILLEDIGGVKRGDP